MLYIAGENNSHDGFEIEMDDRILGEEGQTNTHSVGAAGRMVKIWIRSAFAEGQCKHCMKPFASMNTTKRKNVRRCQYINRMVMAINKMS